MDGTTRGQVISDRSDRPDVRRLLIIVLCSALFALFVGGLIALTSPMKAPESNLQLEVALANLKQLGGTDDLAGLAPPVPADADNAAVAYRRAFDALGKLDAADRKLLDLAVLFRRPQDVTAIADRLEATVQAARKASALVNCVWNPDFFKTGAMSRQDALDFDEMSKLSVAVAAHAMARAGDGRLYTTVQDITTLRRMGVHAATHPNMTLATIGTFMDTTTFEVIEEVYRSRALPSDVSFAAPRDYFAQMRSTLLTHGAAGLMLIDDPDLAPAARYQATWKRDDDKAGFLQAMCRYIWALAPRDGVIAAPRTNIPPEAIYASAFVPGPAVFLVANTATTRSRMAGVAIELAAYRDANGAYPDTWTMPANPTTGEPLPYRRDGSGFVLSTGDNELLDWRWE